MKRALDAGFILCMECHAVNRMDPTQSEAGQTCVRCHAAVYPRSPNSLMRTWALLLTAAMLFIPANMLPIMVVSSFGKDSGDTILSGVIALIHYDMVPIALVVFIASILVPTFKLVGMGLLLYSIQRHQPLSARQRGYMFRFIEWIGRWSMLDIFVIAILVSLVSFGSIAQITAGPGAIAFALVVITTMLAATTFDPRLIWDNTESEEDHD
ncbi:paraquat-inducible protein A [Atopomonas sediminilitoris]|uniref:paraquat-inducible protein A n=1 Tax=Atopomonas sediminilitoris TaxID=2919919 RepID=UPI001F4EF38E|nr:paraquat-inducible protein A [Atopomonas sediminilitoris]MCJ8168762.1 paraquat-inducible protein A [Atopomonas sediminilitoris]